MSPLNSPSGPQEAWLRFSLVPGVSPSKQRSLLQAFGGPEEVMARSSADLARVVGPEVAHRMAPRDNDALVAKAMEWLARPDRHLLALGDSDYPAALLATADPPTVIYAVGQLELLARPAVAVVGSRNATPQGRRDAHAFALALSRAGCCVVSGLALGVDAAAHRGGLEGEGSSIAVLGTGADIIYPRSNHDIAQELATKGCVISEFPLGTKSLAGNFPRRNRLISGLSLGVLVVEAARQSGSLITARYALEQGRDVFAVPGSIHSPLSKGCHDLIKQGAMLVESADDILAELFGVRHPSAGSRPQPAPADPLLDAMGFAPFTPDQIAQRTGIAAGALASQLSRLELEGHVSPLAGGWFQRVSV